MLFTIIKQLQGISALRLKFLCMKIHVNFDWPVLKVTPPRSVTVLSNTSCNTRVELPAVTRAVMLLEVIKNILTSKSAAICFFSLLTVKCPCKITSRFLPEARMQRHVSQQTQRLTKRETRSTYLQNLGAYMASLYVKSNAVSENFVTFLSRK